MVELEFMKNVEIFKGLTESHLASIYDFCTEKNYRYAHRLFAEGEKADYLWIVKEGTVDLRYDPPGGGTSEKNTISSISTQKTFGWSSLVPPYKYRLSAYCANESCRVIRVDKNQLVKLFGQNSKIGYVVMSNLTEIVGVRYHQLQDSAWVSPYAGVKISVHMATCGIAAGAREVMSALMDEMAKTDRLDIRIMTAGCIGMCDKEPNLTVEIEGEDSVIYQKITPDKMRRIFNNHILKGTIETDFVLT